MSYVAIVEGMDAKERKQFDAALLGKKASTGSAELRQLMASGVRPDQPVRRRSA